MKAIFLASLFLFAGLGRNLAQPGWTYANTGINHTILLPVSMNPQIGNQPIAVGDFVGVFYQNNGNFICGGYCEWDGGNTALSAWGNDPLTPVKDGFNAGEEIIFQIWRFEENITCPASIQVDATSINDNHFQTDGMTFLSGLTGMPPLDLGPNQEHCNGESVELSPFFYSTYYWSTGSTDSQLTVNQTGTYSLTVTTPIGQMTDEVLINFLPSPDVTITSMPLGNNGLILSAANGFSSYHWNSGQTTDTIHVFQNGTYTLTVTNPEGCEGNDQIEINSLSWDLVSPYKDINIIQTPEGLLFVFQDSESGIVQLISLNARIEQSLQFTNSKTWFIPKENDCPTIAIYRIITRGNSLSRIICR